MNKVGKRLWIVAVMCVTVAAGNVWADEIAELKKQMAEMQAKLLQLEQQQAAQQQQVAAQDQKIAAIKPGEMTIPETLKWVEKIKIYGDFRYRYENVSYERNGGEQDAVNRNRIRLRLGLTAKINDEVTLDTRVATGKYDEDSGTINGDPTSSNQNLGDSWTYKGMWLDRAYITWKPAAAEGLSVLVGKFGVPYTQVGKNQLLWDGDLSMEGIAAQYNLKFNDSVTGFVNGGGYYVRLDENDTDSISMFGAQAGMIVKLDENNSLTGGAGYYDFGNLQGETTLVKDNTSKGNSTVTVAGDKYYIYDYDLFEVFGEYNTKIGELPVGVYGDYALNTASSVQEDTGWLIGTSLNKCKDPGSWEMSYDYRDIEQDAVIGAFNDSDFIGGGTGGRGHRFGITYQLAKNMQAGLSYFMNEKANAEGKFEDYYNRLQADLMVKF